MQTTAELQIDSESVIAGANGLISETGTVCECSGPTVSLATVMNGHRQPERRWTHLNIRATQRGGSSWEGR